MMRPTLHRSSFRFTFAVLLGLLGMGAWAQAPVPSLSSSSQACFGTPSGSASISVSSGTAPFTYIWDDQIVWINELHYDNVGSDVGEGFEIAGPAGLDLSGYSVELYNGSGGALYNTINLSGNLSGSAPGFGVLWFDQSGIQNGERDGIALIGPGSTVIQFLSYEGSFTATSGTCNGLTSEDIGVFETSTSPVGQSLQLRSSGSAYGEFIWENSATATPDATNNTQTFINLDSRTDLPGGSIDVTVVDAAYLTGSTSFTLAEGVAFTVNSTVTDPTCFGGSDGSIDVTLSGGAAGQQILFDGNITDGTWGSPLATSAGGPVPGFGFGHEVNALYVASNPDSLFFAIAGDVQSGNRIMIFVDSRSGGYNDGNFGRDFAPPGINNFNSTTTFDPDFFADFAFVLGTDGGGTYFFDLFELSGFAGSGGGPNNFLGTQGTVGLGASPASSTNTQGFEWGVGLSQLGFTGAQDLKIFVAYTGESGFLSNQFLTPAGSGDGNYGNGMVTFGAANPDPVTVTQPLPYDISWSSGQTTEDIVGLASGTYTITVTDALGCDTSVAITVNDPAEIIPTISPAGPLPICTGGSELLTASATGGSGTYTGYQWQLDGIDIPGATSSTYTATASGDYTVVVTDDLSCVSSPSAVTTLNNNDPTPTLIYDEPNETICAGELAVFTASAVDAIDYDFLVNGISAQSGASDTYNTDALVAGDVVTVRVTNTAGCVGESSGVGPFTVNACNSPAVVINKYQNGGLVLGADSLDAIELLVIQDNLDMRGMIVKDFGSSLAGDNSTSYEFSTDALWSSVRSGTLIILRNDDITADTDASDYVLDVGLENSSLFNQNLCGTCGASSNLNIGQTDMVMIKSANSGFSGWSENIHTLATGDTVGTLFENLGGYALHSSDLATTLDYVHALNPTSSLADYDGDEADVLGGLVFGEANNADNGVYICSLRDALGAPTSGGDLSLCGPVSADVSATPADWANSIAWYDASSGGTLLGTGLTYTTPVLSTTTTYYAASLDEAAQCESTTRTAVTVNITTVPADPGPGVSSWNVLAYDDTSFTTYRGFYTAPSHAVTLPGYGAEDFEFNTALDFIDTGSPSDAGTYNGCTVDADTFAIAAIRQGFDCAYYDLFLQYYDDNMRLLVDQNGDGTYETQINDYAFPAGCCGSPGVIWSGYLGTNSIVQIQLTDIAVNTNVHLIFDQIVGAAVPAVDLDDVSTVGAVCTAGSVDLILTYTGHLGTNVIEPVSVDYTENAVPVSAGGLLLSDPITVTPPLASNDYILVSATDGAGCAVTTTGSKTIAEETPPSAATINTIDFNCSGSVFLANAVAPPLPEVGTWSVVSGSGIIVPGALAGDGILSNISPGDSSTVRWTVSNGVGAVCPDETSEQVVKFGTGLATTADGNITCTPTVSSGSLQYFATADGLNLYLAIDPRGNTLGATTVELPGSAAITTPAAYWGGLSVPNGAYGDANDPARMPSGAAGCPDELFVEDVWEIDVSSQPDSSVLVRAFMPVSVWDNFLTNGNNWLDGTPGLRTSYEGCYVSFPSPGEAPATSNLVMTGHHTFGRTLHPAETISLSGDGNYYEISWLADTFSTWSASARGSGSPLPIDLVAFWGDAGANANTLYWQTGVEINASHFEVERSLNAQDFETVGSTEAVAAENEGALYEFVDAFEQSNNYYYRLKMIDQDASFKYSELIFLPAEFQGMDWIAAYPNPFSSQLFLQFSMDQDAPVRIVMRDVLGRLVLEQQMDAVAGIQNVELRFNQIQSGSYILEVIRMDNGQRINRQFIKSTE